MEPKKSLVGQMVDFLQYFENWWFLGFLTKSRFFEVFILLNFDTFYKFGCNSVRFEWIFDLKTANDHKIPQPFESNRKFQKKITSDSHHLMKNRPGSVRPGLTHKMRSSKIPIAPSVRY